MKKLILTLLFIIPLISGCASVNTNLTINKNKSAQIEVKMFSNKQTRPLELATMSENIKRFTEKDYEITDESTHKKINVTAVKKVKNLMKEDLDLSSLGFVTKLDSGKFIEVKHNFFVTSYNIHMIYDLRKQGNKIKYVKNIVPKLESKSALIPEYLQNSDSVLNPVNNKTKSGASFDFIANFDPNFIEEDTKHTKIKTEEIDVDDDYKLFDINNFNAEFSISLPSFASFNNAQKSENGVYIWKLNKTAPTEIKLQYVVYSGFAISLMILAGILFLIYVARRVYRHDTLKRIGNNN